MLWDTWVIQYLQKGCYFFFYLRWLGKAQGPWEGVSFEPNPKCCEGTFSAKIWESSRLNVHGFVNLEDHCPVLKRKGNKKWQKHTGMGAEASEWFICELWSALNHCGSEKYPVLCGFWSRVPATSCLWSEEPSFLKSNRTGLDQTLPDSFLFCFGAFESVIFIGNKRRIISWQMHYFFFLPKYMEKCKIYSMILIFKMRVV